MLASTGSAASLVIVPVIIARFFNTVGPRQTGRYGMVLPSLSAQAVRQQPITVFGSGEQSRCFAHVEDVAESVKRLISTPKAYGQVFNIGSNRVLNLDSSEPAAFQRPLFIGRNTLRGPAAFELNARYSRFFPIKDR